MIQIYVHGRGRGHATRSLAIARALVDAGHDVHAFAGGDAYPMMRDAIACDEVESLPPRPSLRPRGLLARRTAKAVAALHRQRARLVIADGDLPAVLAARLSRRPVIAVGHGLTFSRCKRPSWLPKPPWWREALKAAASTPGASHYIAVNFVPLEPRGTKTTMARPAIDPALHREPDASATICYFRDGAPEVLRLLVELGRAPIVFAPQDPRIDGVTWHPPDRAAFIDALSRARIVVGSAGSQLVSECAALGIPVFALHGQRDDEQWLNAIMVREAGLGDGCAFEALTLERLLRFCEHPPTPRAQPFDAPDVTRAVIEAAARLML
jgi:UDP-N-acetylglucosamine--N-acetylmuramyl-(pentapeptide) pyrophosphoryl-undecaprenol N-acetylglucosamine transferase